MNVRVLTTCHTQYTSDSSICIFLFNRTTLTVFVTYLTGALYMHPLWFYKHQHDNPVRSKLFVACQRWWFQWRFWFVPSVPGYLRQEEEPKPDPWRNPIEGNHMGLHLKKEVARRVASEHHRSHARSIAAVNAGLNILWRVTKTWNVILFNKKHIYTYLKCIVYDKLLKPRQSFRVTLYNFFFLKDHLENLQTVLQ